MLSMATKCTEKGNTFFPNLIAFIVSYSKNIWLLHGENIINIVCTNVYIVERAMLEKPERCATSCYTGTIHVCGARAHVKNYKIFYKNSIVCFAQN